MDKVDIRLDKLVLRNYKGFYTGDDENGVEITFDKDLTVFIGDNGSGKSAVLDAVALFLGKLREELTGGEAAGRFEFPPKAASNISINKAVNNRMKEELIIHKEEDDKKEEGDEVIKERCELDAIFKLSPNEIIDRVYGNYLADEDDEGNETKGFIEKNRSPKIGFSILMKRNQSPEKMEIRKWEHHSSADFEDEYDNDARTLQLFIELMRKKEVDNLPILVFYGANSINTILTEKKDVLRSSIFDSYENALEAERFDFNEFFVWYEDQQKRDLMRKKIGVSRKQAQNLVKIGFVENAISTVLDEKDNVNFKDLFIDWFSEPNDMKITKEDIKEKNTSLEKLKNEDVIPLSFDQLSSGERTLIALVADLTRRLCLANPNADNPLHGNGIVLIDEIDVHLHPKWQQKVVIKLRKVFPNVQFVVTTHSPEVLKGLDRKHLRIVKNNTVTSKVPYIKGRDNNAILQDAFGIYERLPEYEEKLSNFYKYVDSDEEKEKLKARKILDDLKKDWGEMDEEIQRAESYYEIF